MLFDEKDRKKGPFRGICSRYHYCQTASYTRGPTHSGNFESLAVDRKVQFRIVINSGDLIVDRNELYGDGVNLAARLENLAEPGGICISRKVLEEVRDKLEVGYEFLGRQSVKNIKRPIPVHRVVDYGDSLLNPEFKTL